MELLKWLLEPMLDQNGKSIRRELARLREGTGACWAIAEVIERMFAVAELVCVVDARVKSWKS